MNVLVTGGCGYIGSHTVVELLNNDYNVIIVDNLSNSKKEVIDSIKKITGKEVKFYKGNVENKTLLKKIFKENKIDSVIHFAGLKAVGESVQKPLLYYRTNLDTTITLCETMNEFNVKKIVFSSSATVYGYQEKLPINEEASLSTTNPYGSTKLYIEGILNDLSVSDPTWSIIKLRYFNPVGAHESGLIGENPKGLPNNLMPYIVKVANKEIDYLNIFGNDYNTKDGTGVRDYIHVVDLAKGHIASLKYLEKNKGCIPINLGTGEGYTVLDIVKSFEKYNKVIIQYKIVDRRPGDIEACFADPRRAKKLLNWEAKLTLKDMVTSSYNYIKLQKK